MGTFIKTIKIITITALMLAWIKVQPVYAASLVVNTNTDNTTAGDGLCTLREAINNANSNSDTTNGDCVAGAGADTISFAGNYTITLSGSQLPVVTTTITINGNGETNTTIQANANPNVATNRIFEVASTGNLTLNGLTIRNGRCSVTCPTSANNGGGIYTAGTLALTNSTISGNSAIVGGGIVNAGTLAVTKSTISGNSGDIDGGGIYNIGMLAMTNSTISGNSANASSGGGIYNNVGTTTVTNSTISGNSAGFVGGGIRNLNGITTVTNSTISGNSAIFGGGIVNAGTLTVTNSTISSNSVSNSGGGIDNNSGTTTVTNSTISGNSANIGGGINNFGMLNFANTIIANSTSGGDCANANTIGTDTNNLVEDNSCSPLLSGDPNLGPLANNGGPTQTHALLASSPAIDAGNNTTCTNAPVNDKDQRGVSRPQGTGCDVGAFEYTGDDTPLTVLSSQPSNNSIRQSVAQITVTYNKAALSDGSSNAANNAANYLLVEQGANDFFDTKSCQGGRGSDDTQITVNSVTYNGGAYTATLNINGGTPLPKGIYRLFVCGTTSVYDLIGLELNGGLSDSQINFTIQPAASSLPKTGFAPNRITSLPAQPANLTYNNLGNIWLEIPSLNIKTDIVGVPQSSNGWNVDWLGQSAGWLNGTAFPSWEGNSVITAHVTDSNGKNGPFANIKNLKHGDKIIVHMYGEKYIFEVRDSNMVTPSSTKSALEHLEGHSYLTLITCQTYNPLSDSYLFRRVVRAVLVETQME
ncbi:MAG: sortase [Anaerolineales bacterium]|nr:sortase [Anaerolineales bacterium]